MSSAEIQRHPTAKTTASTPTTKPPQPAATPVPTDEQEPPTPQYQQPPIASVPAVSPGDPQSDDSKEPPKTAPSTMKQPFPKEDRPINKTAPSASAAASNKKLPAIDLNCRESMPAFFDFSDLPNPPAVNLLPHVITTVSYVAIKEFLQTNKAAPKARPKTPRPYILSKVISSLERISMETARRPMSFNKPVPKMKRRLKKLEEVVRVRQMGLPTWPLEDDLPLGYDWGPSSSLGLGSRAGSAAWNRILVLQAFKKLGSSGLNNMASCRISQVSSVDLLAALKQSLKSSPLSPPPYYKSNLRLSKKGAPEDDKPTGKNPVKDATTLLARRMSKAYQMAQSQQKKADRTFAQECRLLSADEMRSRLGKFQETVDELKARYEKRTEPKNEEEESSADMDIDEMSQTDTEMDTSNIQPAERDRSLAPWQTNLHALLTENSSTNRYLMPQDQIGFETSIY